MRSGQAAAVLGAGFVLCAGLSGCLVAGYSSEGGWWVWPGSAIVTLVMLLLYFLNRR